MEDWLSDQNRAKSHFQLTDVLENTKQSVGAAHAMVRTRSQEKKTKHWRKETVPAGSQMWSDQIAS